MTTIVLVRNEGPIEQREAPRPVQKLASAIVVQALKDALAGRPISRMGLEPWCSLGLKPERLPAVLERARRVVAARQS